VWDIQYPGTHIWELLRECCSICTACAWRMIRPRSWSSQVSAMSDAERATPRCLSYARLRDPTTGCPWDREQTFATIAPFTIEERMSSERSIATIRNSWRDELGRPAVSNVFTRMAQERGWFDFAGVASSIHDKLVRRHPHVFAGAPVEGLEAQSRNWEELKARERADSAARQNHRTTVRCDVPKALPALARAAKLGRAGGPCWFDWQEPGQSGQGDRGTGRGG